MISATLDKDKTLSCDPDKTHSPDEEHLDQTVLLNFIGDRIENLIRDNQNSADILKNAHVDKREPSTDDIRLIYSTLLECMGTQRAILYLFYMALENGKLSDWAQIADGSDS